MYSIEPQELARFLSRCSPVSLSDFLLSRLNRVANLRRSFAEAAESLMETMAHVEIARLLRGEPEGFADAALTRYRCDEMMPQPSPKPAAIASSGTNFWHWILDETTVFSPMQKLILLTIKRFQFGSGLSSVSIKTICEAVGRNRSWVHEELQTLRKKGVVTSIRTGRANKWRVTMPGPNLVNSRYPVDRTSDVRSTGHQITAGADLRSPAERASDVHSSGHQMSAPPDPSSVVTVVSGGTPPIAPPLGQGGHPTPHTPHVGPHQETSNPTPRVKQNRNPEINVGTGPDPAAFGARVNPETLERIRKREEERLKEKTHHA